MTDRFNKLSRALVSVMFSSWAYVVYAPIIGGAMLVAGIDPHGTLFWIVVASLVVPWVLWDLAWWAYFAARGRSYRDFKREVRRKVLAEMSRSREARRHAG